ncbi:hypothetical protein RQP46_002471 [Phenoliferia psychrophenolica]
MGYDTKIGVLLLGTWVNSFLYMIEMIQAWSYYRDFPTDSLFLKSTVASALLVDTASTVSACACVYKYVVTNWGNATYLGRENWGIPFYCITTGISSGIVQMFLIGRAGRLIKSRSLKMVVVGTLSALSIGSVASAFWTGIIVAISPFYQKRGQVVVSATVWLAASAGTDFLIAVALLWRLIILKKQHQSAAAMVESRMTGVLERLVVTTIETGSATATVALVILTTYLADKETNTCVGIGFTLGRIYTLTMLMNLNPRKELVENRQNLGQRTPTTQEDRAGVDEKSVYGSA